MTCLSSLFDLNKTIQVTAYLLKQSENKMNYLRLLKLLYLINREALKEDANLIIYDTACALRRGPILSTVYDLIKGQPKQMSWKWQQYIKTGKFDVSLVKCPGDDELSRFEKKIIESVFAAHEENNDFALIDFTHNLPEWKKYEPDLESVRGRDSYHIKLRDIVNAISEETGKNSVVFSERVKRNVAEMRFFTEQK